ncbi:aromatic prenyltransferase [Hyaloscypha variabilis F]|uniref:Aromatic prenyltransferase n=1 Tax=Hyaloscypha variabilis (strain UAMH 11265 / GT02V1 / F) TaxID=1149755 RepID=A0A2J6RJB7_HYAVF|nr:aromatic prenyltransferase [Hyaloscypha variabilis F]
MSSSVSSKSPKKDQLTITTTELPASEHTFPNDTIKSVISREIAVFQELLSTKTLQSEIVNIGDNQALVEERQATEEDDRISQPRAPTVKQILAQDINPTSQMFNVESFTPSAGGPCFASASQAFWYGTTTPLLSKLLGTASYPPHLQDQYIFFYNHSILPGLSPTPSSTNKWTPQLTHNASPFEPSLTFHNNQQKVRIAFEPIGPLAGTPKDPLNQTLPLTFVSSLASSTICPTLNLELWRDFTTAFLVSDAELVAPKSLFVDTKIQPTCFLAFDLPCDEFAPVLKAYLFPQRRALIEGKEKGDLIFEAIRKSPSFSADTYPDLEKFESFLARHVSQPRRDEDVSGEKEKGLSVEMLAFDCVSPARSRLEICAKTHDTSFANVRDVFTLGGRLKGSSTVEGLKALERFWRSLLLLREDWDDYESQSAEFLYFGFEVCPGKEQPDVKIYVPSWTLGIDKTGLTRGLGRYFREVGWDVGKSYRNDMQQVFGGLDEKERSGYTYISFAYGEKGPAVTICCAPKFVSS